MHNRTQKPLFEVKEVDRRFYEERLRDFLPERMIDMHTHVHLREFKQSRKLDGPRRTVTWPSLVADQNPIEDLIETYRLMFPGKQVTPLIFSSIFAREIQEQANAYIAAAAHAHGFPALLFSHPDWPAEALEQRLRDHAFFGIKSYLSYAASYLPRQEIRIYDFFPHHQLEVLDRLGGIVMLHVPRDARLRDPVNLAQLLEIEQRYQNLQLVVAHVGRAYCDEDLGDAFEHLASTKRMHFDISANTNETVFRRLLETVGPQRVLFGSDLPILRMRTRRICENGVYINLVPKGLYGDESQDPHLRALTGKEAEALTFFMYEEIDAFRRAAGSLGLSAAEVADVFYHNARRMLAAADPKSTRAGPAVAAGIQGPAAASSQEVKPEKSAP